jgi:hypothetical protein
MFAFVLERHDAKPDCLLGALLSANVERTTELSVPNDERADRSSWPMTTLADSMVLWAWVAHGCGSSLW